MPQTKQYGVKFQNELGNYSLKNGSHRNKSISKYALSFINSVCQILIIDIIFVIFNKYINSYTLFSINQLFTFAINFSLTYLSLNILRKFDTYSSEFALNLEKKIKLSILDNGDSSFNSLSIESQCLDLFYLIRNGIVSIINLLLYPIRFGVLGYIFFNNNWKLSLFVSNVIGLLFFTAVFEFLRIRLLIIPRQKLIFIKINDYLDNLKTLLLLGAHRESYINSSKTNTFINIFKNLLNYALVTLHTICIMYFISLVLHYFNENLRHLELSRIYVFNYWLAIYLLYSTRYINSGMLLMTNYNYLNSLSKTSKSTTFNSDLSSKITSEYNNRNYEMPDNIPVSEPLSITKKDSTDELEITKKYDILHEKFPFINNNYDNSIKKYSINYSTSGKLFNVDVKTEYLDNNTIQNYNDMSNYKKPNHAQFNSGIIFYKNLSLSVSYEKRRRINIKNSSSFNYFGLFGKKKMRQAYSNGFNEDQLDKIIGKEWTESQYCLKNVNLYIKMNESIIIFGSDNIGKELLTKFISGFPGIQSDDEQLLSFNSPGFANYEVHLFNRNMLELVSDLYDFQKSEFAIDPFDFILSGNSFHTDIFELIYDSFLLDYFAKSDPSQESNETIKYYIYPKVESNQEFVEAKIFLQLSQFFYNILISFDNCPSVIVIDGIFELLLPNTYIRLAEKLLSDNSVFSEFNISFVITTENDLFPYLSNLYSNNPCVKLAILNENGLQFTNDNHLNEKISKKSVESLPPIDNAINKIFINSKKDYVYSSKSLYYISELCFKKIGSGNFYTKRFLFFAYIIGLVSFGMKIMIFSNNYLNKILGGFGSVYDYFIFEILSFSPLLSSVGTSSFHSNDISSLLIGYIAISSFFLGSYNTPLSELKFLANEKDNFIDKSSTFYKDLPKFLGATPEENYKSSSFIQFDGRQTLKATSLFYKDHFSNSQVISIPGVNSLGFKNAIISSKKIQDKLKIVSKKPKSEVPPKNEIPIENKRELKFILSRDIILIIVGFVSINICSKILIYISIFGSSFIDSCLNYSNYYFHEFLIAILSSDDPISVINDIKMRRNKYFPYLFEEIYNKKGNVAIHYLTIIHGLSLLFFFAISNNVYSNTGIGILINKNLLIITFLFPVLYNLVKFFNFNGEKTKPFGVNCNSVDNLYYLRKSNSLSWFKDQTSKLFKIKLENSNKLVQFKFNLLLNSLMLSITSSILYFLINYIRGVNNKQLIMDLTIFLPVMFFLIHSINFHTMNTSKANNFPNINPHGCIKWFKSLFYKTIYFPMYMSISSYSGSPRTNRSFSPDNKESIPTEDGYELSTPISNDSHNTDPILSMNSIPIKLNSDMTLKLMNPLLLLDDSLTFGSASSPLFPIKQSRTLDINIDKTAVVSNHNLVSSSWPINMVLDPKGIYMNDYERLLHTLESLYIFPKILRNVDPKLVLGLSVQEYSDLINDLANGNNINNDIHFANSGLEFKVLEPRILAEHDYNKDQSINTIHMKKLLLFGHYALYSMQYKELILHLDYDMDLNFWIHLVEKFFQDKKSSIKNIVIISPDYLKQMH